MDGNEVIIDTRASVQWNLIKDTKTKRWSQLIIERFRDAVTNRPTSSETPGFGADSGVDFSGNTRRGGCCGMNMPGA